MPDIKIEHIYPLAPFQEVIYEHATNEPDTNAYFEQTIWALEGSWILNSLFSVSNNWLIVMIL